MTHRWDQRDLAKAPCGCDYDPGSVSDIRLVARAAPIPNADEDNRDPGKTPRVLVENGVLARPIHDVLEPCRTGGVSGHDQPGGGYDRTRHAERSRRQPVRGHPRLTGEGSSDAPEAP